MSKVIEINPDFLSLGVKKAKKKNKKQNKEKGITRRKMLHNIMNLRKEKEETGTGPTGPTGPTDEDPLRDLNEFVKDYKRRLTLKKKKNITVPVMEGDMSSNTVSTPKYSCLKNSSTPTYKQLNKTMRNRISFPDNVVKSTTCIDDIDTTMKDKYDVDVVEVPVPVQVPAPAPVQVPAPVHVQEPAQVQVHVQEPAPAPAPAPASKSKTRKVTKTCKVGKNSQDNKVHILVPNRHTRKRETSELESMSNMPLSKVKQYLRSRMLIHSGCDAPEHILREMMRSVILSGDVRNCNKEHILKDLEKYDVKV